MPIPNPVHPFVRDAHFREWAWADESSWSHHVRIPYGNPVKSGSNPILDLRAGKFDSHHVGYYGAGLFRYGNYFYLVYGASANVGVSECIGIARSTDLINWTRFNDPIIERVAATWESAHVCDPNVVVDEELGKYVLFYEGTNGGLFVAHDLGVAECDLTDDPTVAANWTKYGANPLGFPACIAPNQGVLKVGNLWWMQYRTAASDLNVASADSRYGAFVDRGQILTKGAGGTWDDNLLALANAFWNSRVFYSLYSGHDGAVWKIGLATSGSGFGTFIKYPPNPTISPAGAGWESVMVVCPTIIMWNEKFYIYYVGYDGTHCRIGLATIP